MRGRKTRFDERLQFKIPSIGFPTPKEFAENLLGRGLIARTAVSKRRRGPRRIDVLKEVSRAYSFLCELNGFNEHNLIDFLEKSRELDFGRVAENAEAALENRAIIAQVPSGKKELVATNKALETIIFFVKRQRRRKALAKAHSLGPRAYAERRKQETHLKSIKKGR